MFEAYSNYRRPGRTLESTREQTKYHQIVPKQDLRIDDYRGRAKAKGKSYLKWQKKSNRFSFGDRDTENSAYIERGCSGILDKLNSYQS